MLEAWNATIGFSYEPVSWIRFILDLLGFELNQVASLRIAAPTSWPLLSEFSDFPTWIIVIVLAFALYWSTRSLKAVIICSLLFAFALLSPAVQSGKATFFISLITLIPGVVLGLFLGYLHAAYTWVRPFTWTALWIVLALPLIAIAAIAVGALEPNQFSIELWALIGAPMGVMARGSALALEHIDPELQRQARRLGATLPLQVRLLSWHLSVPAIRASLHQAIMVYFFTAIALGAVGLPGMGQEIWLAVKAGDLALVIFVGAKIWALAVAMDVLLQFRGRGRLLRMMEA